MRIKISENILTINNELHLTLLHNVNIWKSFWSLIENNIYNKLDVQIQNKYANINKNWRNIGKGKL
jgi:HKD family nuclease